MAHMRLKLSITRIMILMQCLDRTIALTFSLDRFSSPERPVDYDLVIIGAGASGLFASGAAISFGMKTLLLDKGKGYVGGDCSNAACVPSKALRSIAKMTRRNITPKIRHDHTVTADARDYISQTVAAIRQREDIGNFDNISNLELVLVESAKFVSKDEVEIVPRACKNESLSRRIRSRRFLIATGASPFIPNNFLSRGLPLYTYRDILLPNSDNSAWNQFSQNNSSLAAGVIIAGGGPTAVELGQTLARLNMNITIVAPTLLAMEDVSLQQAACQILLNDGVQLRLGRRIVGVDSDTATVLLDDGTKLYAGAMVVCVGRKPTVEGLNLDAAGIAWDPDKGIVVHPSSLRSCTNPRVFACGDCCSAVTGKDRKAAHAAWTGYHAIRNMVLPRFLWAGSPSLHSSVPSVTYADPELASVGFTRSECLKHVGSDGLLAQAVQEEGNDRADMERKERFVDACFVELRVNRRSGRILGLSACGPAAAELANEVGVAIQNRLTVRDLARSIHAYPSHGYILYRLSLSMALSSTRGFLETLGPVGRFFGRCYGCIAALIFALHPKRVFPWKRARRRKQQLWEGEGEEKLLIPQSQGPLESFKNVTYQSLPMSFLEYYRSYQYSANNDADLPHSFKDWMDRRPQS